MATLSYSITEPALRSPVAEWQPHRKQSESTTEWWYVTALVHDTAGNSYFLAWCPFHFTGEKASPASAGLPRYERATAALTGFTDYRDNFRIADFPAAVVNGHPTISRVECFCHVIVDTQCFVQQPFLSASVDISSHTHATERSLWQEKSSTCHRCHRASTK